MWQSADMTLNAMTHSSRWLWSGTGPSERLADTLPRNALGHGATCGARAPGDGPVGLDRDGALAERAVDGFAPAARAVRLAQPVEHHRGREHHRQGVRPVGAGDVRRRAVDRLEVGGLVADVA